MPSKYAVVSLPIGAFDTNDKDDAVSALKSNVSSDNGTVFPFKVPDFKIGTLDALVQQADDLAKLESTAEAVVAKVADSLRTILNGDEDRLASYKMVNDSQCSLRLSARNGGHLTDSFCRADRAVREQLLME